MCVVIVGLRHEIGVETLAHALGELRQQELAESVRAARPATPRDESRVLQPTTASASRLIDPEQKFEVKPKQRGRPDAALNPGRRAIPAWRAPLHK